MSKPPTSNIETIGPEFLTQPESDKPQSECGLFAIYMPEAQPIAEYINVALQTLQHRGQLSAGITVNATIGEFNITGIHNIGLVKDVIEPHVRSVPDATIGLGHNRWATSKNEVMPQDILRRATMPIIKSKENHSRHDIAVAGNFNFKFARDVAEEYGYNYDDFASDGDFVSQLIMDKIVEIGDEEKAITEVLTIFKDDAFCLAIMTNNRLFVAQDPRGFRPLHRAKMPGGGWTIASERGALNIIGATEAEEFEPGHMMVVDETGVRIERIFEEMPRKLCLFEHVYVSRPDNEIEGVGIWDSRHEAGQALSEIAPVEADFVAGVPESGLVVGYGYSYKSGIQYKDAFVKNRYIGRTYIEHGQKKRDSGVKIKLVPIPENVKGKSIVVTEDSIVRGTTSRSSMADLRAAGAREIHLRVASPQVLYACFYAMDMKVEEGLLANQFETVEEMADYLGVDTLAFLPRDRLLVATKAAGIACDACFTGNYPTEVPVDLRQRN